MFPFNIIIVNPTDTDFRSFYVKINGQSVSVFTSEFKYNTQIYFISRELKPETTEGILKYFAEKYTSLPVLLLQTIASVENMAKPKFVIKEWKNGEITVKEKSKTTKGEEFAFINDLPEHLFETLNHQPEPAVQGLTPEQVNHFFTTVGTTATNATAVPPNAPGTWTTHPNV